MAINISQQPQELARSGNALTYTFTSTQTNQPNFAFIIDVYKDGVIHSEHRVYPENGTYGRFDLSEIAEYETTKPNIPSSVYVDAQNYADFYIVAKEFYGVNPVVVGTSTSNTSLFFKSRQGIYENFYYADYIPSVVGASLMTYFNETLLHVNELFYLYALKLPADPYVLISYRTISGLEAHVHNQSLVNHDCLGVKLDYLFLQANYNPIPPVTWEEITSIVITITNGTEYYNDYTIKLNHSTTCIKPTRIHWLNKIGGMESYSFTKPTREEQKTNVQSFETSDGQWFGSFYGISNEDTGNATFQTEGKKYIELESGFISEEVQRVIYDNLYTSPYILVEWEERLIRVSRDNVTVSYNNNKLDQLFNMKIKVNIENFKSAIV